jgi:hypothetical protein
MEQEELNTLLEDPTKLVNKLTAIAPVIPEAALNIQPENHKVFDITERPKRAVEVNTKVLDANGDPIYRTEYRDVHRIPSATEKTIIDWSVQLSLGSGVSIECNPETDQEITMLAMVQKTYDDNKMDFIRMEIERLRLTYLQAMVVWYSVPAEDGYWTGIGRKDSKFKMRCVVLSPEGGDLIVPIRDQYKDMLGAARFYKVSIDDKDVDKMDLFLKDKYITYIAEGSTWTVEKETLISYGKANFILHEAKRMESQDVEAKLERREEIDSDTADENKQSAFPILVGTGTITSASGGETSNTRKTFQLEGDGADLKYVETQGGATAAATERENLLRDIYMETATPQISFDSASFTGTMPGVSIELMFLPSTNKAKARQLGEIGMAEQRQLNFLKAAMAVINTDVKVAVGLPMKGKFSVDLPRNKTEDYANIVKLVGAGLMSKETALQQLAFTSDPVAELEKINKEAADAAALIPAPVIAAPTNPTANL